MSANDKADIAPTNCRPARELLCGNLVGFLSLLSYGASVADSYHLAGIYTGRILTGEKPGDLPVQRSSKLEIFINAKTAKALGITIPQGLMISADEIFE
ncbi:MAG: ABC transporter substrate binding protein [Pseudolabrys sp.]